MASTAMITSMNMDIDPSPPGAWNFSSSSASSSIYLDEQPLPSPLPLSIISDDDSSENPILNSNSSITNTPFQEPSFSLSTQLPIILPPTQTVTSYTVSSSTYRVSRLPPAPTIYQAGPSRQPQRYLFFAIRKGHKAGVYTVWYEAEKQIINHPQPVYKTFSTRLAAQAFVAGWDGAGRHSLPHSTPRPLREHLAMSFPGSVSMSTTPGRRQSYHSKLLAAPGCSTHDLSLSPLDTSRPALSNRHSYHRHSMVKVSSPLRSQVDEEDEVEDVAGSRLPPLRKASSFIGVGGLLSPPQSPEKEQGKNLSVMDRDRPKSKVLGEGSSWSSRGHRDFSPSNGGLGLVARPLSPPQSPNDKRATIHGVSESSRPNATRRPSGLWADAVSKPNQSSPLSPTSSNQPEFNDPSAPNFSRSGLKKSGVVMPVAAKRSGSSQSLKSMTSLGSLRNGLNSNNSSSSSINSYDRRRSSSTLYQDRLSSLAETSKKELQLNEEGLLALSTLSPPKPAFMTMRRSSSSSSVASNDSFSSMGSLTSNTSSSNQTSLDSCEPIQEEDDNVEIISDDQDRENHDIVISCTKSDGDADGSVGDKDSIIKGGKTKKVKSGGGMFKRLAKALKLEKKNSDRDSTRRGSM
ncbi:uncharacterized protein L201_001606 [Kwoniella dendrophila CBS 6074]|uniref:Ribonuclease H1 N-terminal domain-containing protein n=1 Tax=Kwoniella dendrophila CBS 6074 TaxID=1295534 RepID=A0AAX4JQI0_9TREE